MVAAERRLLSVAGHEVIPLDFENPPGSAEATSALARAPWNKSAAMKVVSAVRDESPDVVHVHNTWFALSPAVFPRVSSLGTPVVATFHNYRIVCVNAMLLRDGNLCELCVGRGPWSGVKFACYRGSRPASVAAAATIAVHRRRGTWTSDLAKAIALTEFARSRLEAGGIPAERIAIVPNFASDPGPRTRSASDSDEVLFVGRLSNEKGIRVLLDAWSQLADPHLRLTVVGSGPLLEEVKAKASGSIKVVGWLEPADVLQHMLSARALVVPSLWYEVQPLVVLEALACGLPVLYSNLGALGEIVGDGGSPFSAGSPSHLVTRLSEMLDGAEVKRMSDGGRGQFLSRFDTQRALASRIALYQEVVRA